MDFSSKDVDGAVHIVIGGFRICDASRMAHDSVVDKSEIACQACLDKVETNP